MTGPTHREYSVNFACIALMVMYQVGILTLSFNSRNSINYYLAIPIMTTIAKIGARFPDVDHEWEFVRDKTVTNKIINTLIHATGGTHRSWQTHSIDIVVALSALAFILPGKLIENGIVSNVNGVLIYIIAVAFMVGWISHIFSDMLNGMGVRLLFWRNRRVAFVPKKFLCIHFNTGEGWERFNYFVMHRVNIAIGLLAVVYPYLGTKILDMLRIR